MAAFGIDSQKKLNTCHPRLALVLNIAIKIFDFTIVTGFRGEEEQNKAFAEGRSKLKFPDGKHNRMPSEAVDIAPYPIDWSNKPKAVARFYLLAGIIMAVAWVLHIDLRWGGDWDGDWDLFDQNFDDIGHFELREN